VFGGAGAPAVGLEPLVVPRETQGTARAAVTGGVRLGQGATARARAHVWASEWGLCSCVLKKRQDHGRHDTHDCPPAPPLDLSTTPGVGSAPPRLSRRASRRVCAPPCHRGGTTSTPTSRLPKPRVAQLVRAAEPVHPMCSVANNQFLN